jgi:hypothetical protein
MQSPIIHSRSRVLEKSNSEGTSIAILTTTVPRNVRAKILHTRILTTLCPAISHNSALSRCKMARCIIILWYLSAPMIGRIACLMASDSSPQPYRMHSIAGRASTRLLRLLIVQESVTVIKSGRSPDRLTV